MPVLALVLCSLLLTPLDTVASFLVTVVGYVVLDMVVPGLTSWEVVSTLIIVGAVGALSTAEASVRRQDLKHIEGQAAELRKRQNQLVEAQKMEAVARLSSGVAHEFNNILTMINGYAEVIDRRPADDPTIYTARIREAGTRAARLTEGLLAFSQQQLLHLQSADLDKLLKNQGPFLRSVLRKETHLAMDFSPEAKTIKIDVDQFSETLRALLQAAEENLTVGGSLSIGTRTIDLSTNNAMLLPEGAYCTVEIFDNGPAKDQEVQSRLFNPFFTTGEFGSGRLDLAAAYGLVRQLGGQIEMKSEPGRGNTIVVVLPRRGIVT
jgi:signal transduction histidine kinase